MKKTPEQIKKRIMKLKSESLSIYDISKKLKISDYTVKKYSKNMQIKVETKKGGRPKKLFNDISNILVEGFLKGRLQSLNNGRWSLSENHDISVCKQTVKKYLDDNGLKCRVKQKKPFLSLTHKKIGMIFQKNTLNILILIGKRLSGVMSPNSHL
jgi:transposase